MSRSSGGAVAEIPPQHSPTTLADAVKELPGLAADLKTSRRRRIWMWVAVGAAASATVIFEAKTSYVQSHLLAGVVAKANYRLEKGEADRRVRSGEGPYDERLGYTRLPDMVARLKQSGFRVASQTRPSPRLSTLSTWGVFPPYPEKNQAGLTLVGRAGQLLYSFRQPERAYPTFESIPPIVVQSLLFIENREILKEGAPYRNPAVEWERLGKAFIDFGVKQVRPSHQLSGGSTLATQLEKVRHSPNGRTGGPTDKLQQMASASLRAYIDGPESVEARRRTVRDYLNSLPLAATPAHGEVTGLADGLKAWYGTDFERANWLLRLPDNDPMAIGEAAERAQVFRQTLSLLLAINRPSYYLAQRPDALQDRVDAYIRVLAAEGMISQDLRNRALQVRNRLTPSTEPEARPITADGKGIATLRYRLIPLLGLNSAYELDRLDLTVEATLDGPASRMAADAFESLNDPEVAAKAGIVGHRLLSADQNENVIYSFTLYEHTGGTNQLRIQVDTAPGLLNINEDSRLELGSTAKLRTLATYLQIVSELHEQLTSKKGILKIPAEQDRLTAWAIDYLDAGNDPSLQAMLEAAMNRRYSASPGEAFFTGGGLHVFANFDSADNGRIMTVREAFQRSVNLVFIRIMRDLEQYFMVRLPNYSPLIWTDMDNPQRKELLARFADRESAQFLRSYYQRYAGLAPQAAFETLLESKKLSPRRLTSLYRFTHPRGGTVEELRLLLEAYFPHSAGKDADELFGKYPAERFDWNDRGYLADVHPLELWLIDYLNHKPNATWEQVLEDSRQVRQDVYKWLFRPRLKAGQDSRIKTVLELDAFEVMHRYWKKQGYPFRTLVPSLATAIGSSGDTPAALAQLAGVILNGGVHYPTLRVERLRFAEGTPFETRLERITPKAERVFAPEVAEQLKNEMRGVVEKGTARRAFGSAVLRDGTVLPVGGKTGTGDNRDEPFRRDGKWIPGRVRNRTAAFVFTIGDRYFGAITAYVPGKQAASFNFTSALPVQVFKTVIPKVLPLLDVPPAPALIDSGGSLVAQSDHRINAAGRAGGPETGRERH